MKTLLELNLLTQVSPKRASSIDRRISYRESTGIGLIEMGAYLIAHLLPTDGDMTRVSRLFNELMSARFERISISSRCTIA